MEFRRVLFRSARARIWQADLRCSYDYQCFQRFSGSTDSRSCIGDQRAKSERGHTAAAVIKPYPFASKVGTLNHDDTSALSLAPSDEGPMLERAFVAPSP